MRLLRLRRADQPVLGRLQHAFEHLEIPRFVVNEENIYGQWIHTKDLAGNSAWKRPQGCDWE
jgi:hypothetical protein